jgi:hypothetical protein
MKKPKSSKNSNVRGHAKKRDKRPSQGRNKMRRPHQSNKKV